MYLSFDFVFMYRSNFLKVFLTPQSEKQNKKETKRESTTGEQGGKSLFDFANISIGSTQRPLVLLLTQA